MERIYDGDALRRLVVQLEFENEELKQELERYRALFCARGAEEQAVASETL